jgi:ABC-type multidrug transport system fused ATPase/permease subunit
VLSLDVHSLLHDAATLVGHRIAEEAPSSVHLVLHVTLLWGPLAAVALALLVVVRAIVRRVRGRVVARRARTADAPGLYGYILMHSRGQQALLVIGGLAAMPVLYATLELPKLIVNNAIASGHFPVTIYAFDLDQTGYLVLLCGLYLGALGLNGWVKFQLNTFKGRVGERVLRRLRLETFRRWRPAADGPRRAEVIPLMAQEVEPIGGFAAEAFAAPVFHGGALATILVFMFVQDPILGLAAVALTPVQLAVTPPQQRRVTALARERAREVRHLASALSHPSESGPLCGGVSEVGAILRRIETVRRRLHVAKYRMKSTNNFIVAMTPFLFYLIGGWLVIEERLTLGALVAVLAAYKDFSSPMRELFNHARAREDARQRFEDLSTYLATLRSESLRQIAPVDAASPHRRQRNGENDAHRHEHDAVGLVGQGPGSVTMDASTIALSRAGSNARPVQACRS